MTPHPQPGHLRHGLHVPAIAARLLPLRLALAETLLWRLYGFANTVNAAGGAAAGGGGAGQGRQATGPGARQVGQQALWSLDAAQRVSCTSLY